MEEKDVIIIGGGIIGGVISYQLARYDLKILLLEQNSLFADETSKGNSGIIHGGFDPEPQKIEAKLNVKGNKLWREEIFKHLKFPRVKSDSLVLAFNQEEMKNIHMLYDRGLKNKVPKKFMKILSKEEVLKKEPNVNDKVHGALLCTSSWVIDPSRAALSFIGSAEKNGIQTMKNSKVINVETQHDGFVVVINNNKKVFTKNIINAAGHYADKIAEMAGLGDFKQTTRRGEYRILSRTEGDVVSSICFMVPTTHGKGIIVAPTFDGRILIGPTAENGIPKAEARLITRQKFDDIGKISKKIIPSLKIDKTIKIFAGSRPIDIETNDFVIRYANKNKHFINAAGMQSPAIASAPAIALEIEDLLRGNGTKLKIKNNFDPKFKVMW